MIANDDEDCLFKEDFYASNSGPTIDIVDQEYKKFDSLPIKIEKVSIPKENKKYIQGLFDFLKDFTDYDLITLTFIKGSPWNEIYEKYQDFTVPDKTVIDKIKTKNWFNEVIEIEDE